MRELPSQQKNDTRWRLAAETSGLGVWDYDVSDQSRFFSKEWFEIRGLNETRPEDTLDYEGWLATIHKEDRDRARDQTTKMHDGAIDEVNFEYRQRHSKGHWIWILTRGRPVSWDSNGRAQRFVGTDTDITHLRETEAANIKLRDEQMRLDIAVNSAEQGVWDLRSDIDLCYLSDAWRAMRGYPEDSTYGADRQSWIEDVHPLDRDIVLQESTFQADRSAMDLISYQYRQKTKDGRWIWILSRGKVVERGADNSRLRMIGTDTDITEIKAVETKLERLSRTLELAIIAAQVGVWESNLETGDAIWDARTCEIFGLDPSEGECVVPKTFKAFIHPDDTELVRRECDAAARAMKDFDTEYRIVHPVLGTRYLRSQARFHRTADEGRRHVGIVWDVTQERENEQRVRDANALLDDVVEQMEQGLVVFRGPELATSKVLLANKKFAEILELPEDLIPSEMTFRDYLDYTLDYMELPNEDIETGAALVEAAKEGRMLRSIIHLPSGRMVRATGNNLSDGSRIMTFTDVTDLFQSELKRSELAESLSHMERLQAVGKLTGGIAHDFNNLLAVVTGNAELLADELDAESDLLSHILNAAQRGAELTQRLLAFSRKQSLQPSSIDIPSLIDDLQGLLKPTLGDNIVLRSSSHQDLWHCAADVGQLQNAIINLAINGRDAMARGGVLSIKAENASLDATDAAQNAELAPGDFVKITVSDNGRGMSEEVAAKAYDPFFTTKELGEGSGLGLSMVYGFIKQSNGHVIIDSVLGEGTDVHIFLPRTHELPSEDDSPPSSTAQVGIQQVIMLVEDEHAVRCMVERALSQLGYVVKSYPDAHEALAAFKTAQQEHAHFDLILSDIGLPGGMNGFEFGDAIRKIDQDANIIFMSGYLEDDLSERSNEAAKVELILKPFRLTELAALVAKSLSRQDA